MKPRKRKSRFKVGQVVGFRGSRMIFVRITSIKEDGACPKCGGTSFQSTQPTSTLGDAVFESIVRALDPSPEGLAELNHKHYLSGYEAGARSVDLTEARIEATLEQRESDAKVRCGGCRVGDRREYGSRKLLWHFKNGKEDAICAARDILTSPLTTDKQHLLDGLLAEERLEEAKLIDDLTTACSQRVEAYVEVIKKRIAQLEAEAKERK